MLTSPGATATSPWLHEIGNAKVELVGKEGEPLGTVVAYLSHLDLDVGLAVGTEVEALVSADVAFAAMAKRSLHLPLFWADASCTLVIAFGIAFSCHHSPAPNGCNLGILRYAEERERGLFPANHVSKNKGARNAMKRKAQAAASASDGDASDDDSEGMEEEVEP